jgi:hypothetical protein
MSDTEQVEYFDAESTPNLEEPTAAASSVSSTQPRASSGIASADHPQPTAQGPAPPAGITQTSFSGRVGSEGEAPGGTASLQAGSEPGTSDSPEERARKLQQAEGHKGQGNTLYAANSYQQALEQYEDAVAAAPADAHLQLAVYWGNAAACYLQLDRAADCVHACSTALSFNPGYTKVLMRRSTAYEKLDELDKALKDVQQVVELSPGDAPAAAAVRRLQPIVDARTEKLKEETLGKLKDLGNTLLGKFGLSLDNFATEKDPSTGSYSIKFNNS